MHISRSHLNPKLVERDEPELLPKVFEASFFIFLFSL